MISMSDARTRRTTRSVTPPMTLSFTAPTPERAHNHEVIGVGVDVLDKDLKVPSFKGFPLDGQVRLGRLLVNDVQVRVRDDLKTAGNQRIMDLPLPLQLVFIMVFFGETCLHLLKALVMHLGCINVTADELRPKGFRK